MVLTDCRVWVVLVVALVLCEVSVLAGAENVPNEAFTSSEAGNEFGHTEEFYSSVTTVDMTVNDNTEVSESVVSVSHSLPIILPGRKALGREKNLAQLLSTSVFRRTLTDLRPATGFVRNYPITTHGRKRFIHPLDGPYTSSRVRRSTDWPYKMVGRLFFKRPDGQTGSCSACLIQKRLILTAAHCVYRNGHFNTEFEFMPGFVNGTAPFGVWKFVKTWVSSQWSKNPTVPSAQDFGLLSLADRDVDGGRKSAGSVLGWFGVKTNNLMNNHVTSLGYPSNHDSALIMHEVTSQFKRFRTPTNAEYPNDMIEGISGGPWISDFGTTNDHGEDNNVVGIASYRDEDLERRYLGSSVLDDTFLVMYNEACKVEGNCEIHD